MRNYIYLVNYYYFFIIYKLLLKEELNQFKEKQQVKLEKFINKNKKTRGVRIFLNI